MVCGSATSLTNRIVVLSSQSRTPLHEASARGLTRAVILLLDQGADIHAEDVVSICVYTCVCLHNF